MTNDEIELRLMLQQNLTGIIEGQLTVDTTAEPPIDFASDSVATIKSKLYQRMKKRVADYDVMTDPQVVQVYERSNFSKFPRDITSIAPSELLTFGAACFEQGLLRASLPVVSITPFSHPELLDSLIMAVTKEGANYDSTFTYSQVVQIAQGIVEAFALHNQVDLPRWVRDKAVQYEESGFGRADGTGISTHIFTTRGLTALIQSLFEK